MLVWIKEDILKEIIEDQWNLNNSLRDPLTEYEHNGLNVELHVSRNIETALKWVSALQESVSYQMYELSNERLKKLNENTR